MYIVTMADMRTWSREFITEFIELYKSLPCLYDIKSKQYYNKHLKLDSYGQLVDKLKTLDPTSTKDTVVKKINNLRSSYRKELKKVKEFKRRGQVYQTSLWYFNLLNFLYEQEVPRKGNSNIQDLINDTEDDELDRDGNIDVLYKEEASEEDSTQEDPLQECSATSTPTTVESAESSSRITFSRKRKAVKSNEEEAVLHLVADKLKHQHKYSHYAAYVGEELAALPTMAATFCQKLINDVLFEAKCGTLNKQTRLVTGPEVNVNLTVENSTNAWTC